MAEDYYKRSNGNIINFSVYKSQNNFNNSHTHLPGVPENGFHSFYFIHRHNLTKLEEMQG